MKIGGNAIRRGDIKLVRHNGGDWELYESMECTGSEFKAKLENK